MKAKTVEYMGRLLMRECVGRRQELADIALVRMTLNRSHSGLQAYYRLTLEVLAQEGIYPTTEGFYNV